MKRMLEELSSPSTYKKKALNSSESVERGLNFILSLAMDEENFKTFGSDVFLTFYDVATTAEEPLRKFALLRTEVVAQMWLQHYPTLSNNDGGGKKKNPPADEVLDFVMGIYALERVGIGHNSKEEVRNVAKGYNLRDFFDIDPLLFQVSPSSYSKPPLDYREYTQVLTYSFYAEKTGINIQTNLKSVLQLLPLYRPYKIFSGFSYDDEIFDTFADQLTMVFNVVHVLSNYGELQLSSSLLPLETAFLLDENNIELSLKFNDVHLVGEICHCLRVLGVPLTSGLLVKALDFLRGSQSLDGSWPARDQAEDPYFKYHATMCAISALNPQRFRGYGPSEPSIYAALVDISLKTKDTVSSNKSTSTAASKNVDNDSKKVNSYLSFVDKQVPSLEQYEKLRDLYDSKTMAVSNELCFLAEPYGEDRLSSLLARARQIRLAGQSSGSLKRKGGSGIDGGGGGGFMVAGLRSVHSRGAEGQRKKKRGASSRREEDLDTEWKPGSVA